MLSSAAVGLGMGAYTRWWEPQWLEIVHRRLPIVGLPEALTGATLVQLSDLHIGPRVDDDYLRDVFRRVDDLNPQIVVYTGDFISYHPAVIEHATRMFAHLARGSVATLGILGNHDYGPGWLQSDLATEIAALAEDAGVHMLRNDVAEIDGLKFVGMDDLWAKRFDPELALQRLSARDPSIVLTHNPDSVDRDGWGDYSGWVLAGHTHGGQCKPPFLPPPLLPVRNRRYTSGEFALSGARRMYISRGVGHLLQVRFNVRPELTLFELSGA